MTIKNNRRMLWIDILKGIGILSIMYAHTTNYAGVFIYAVPLFFIISGFLHHPTDDFNHFFLKSAKRMLLPYLAFFFIFSLFHIVMAENPWLEFVGRMKLLLWSGNRMQGEFGVFWFINVLFLSLNLFNYMQVKHTPIWAYFCLYLLANSLYIWNVNYPWNVQTIPLALSYMYVGSVMKPCCSRSNLGKISSVKFVCMLFLLIAIVCIPSNVWINMKYNHYGVPFISFILSIITIVILAVISVKLETYPYLSSFLGYCGKASLFLMYIHQAINLHLHFIPDRLIVFILTVLFSLILYFITSKFDYGRYILCGEK